MGRRHRIGWRRRSIAQGLRPTLGLRARGKRAVAAGGGGGFAPTDLTDLLLWVEAERGVNGGTVADGDTVNAWADQSSNAHDLAVGGTGTLVYRRNGGKPYIRAHDKWFTRAAIGSGNAGMACVAIRKVTDAGHMGIFGLGNSATGTQDLIRFYLNTDERVAVNISDEGVHSDNGSVAKVGVNEWDILTLISDGSAHRIRVNGVEQTLSAVNYGGTTGQWLSTVTNDDRFVLLNSYGNGVTLQDFPELDIAAFVITDGTAPTDEEITNVETYIAGKCNGSLYVNAATIRYGSDLVAAWAASDTNTHGGVSFDGTSRYLSNTSGDFNMQSTPFWIGCWGKRTDTQSEAYGQLAGLKGNSGTFAWQLVFRGSGWFEWIFRVSADGVNWTSVIRNSVDAQLNVWENIFAYWDGSEIGISVNGETPVTAAFTGPIFSNTSTFTLGLGQSLVDKFGGHLDQMCIGTNPTAALTDIRDSLYAAGEGKGYIELTATEKTDWGLMSFWELDEAANAVRVDSHGVYNLADNGTVPSIAGVVEYEPDDGDPVSIAIDISGNRNTMVQDTATHRSLYVASEPLLNGLPAWHAEGTDDHLEAAGEISTATAGAVFFVFVLDALGKYQNIIASADVALGKYWRVFVDNANKLNVQGNGSVNNFVTGDTILSAGIACLGTVISNGTAWRLRINGVEQVLAGTNSGLWWGDIAARDNFSLMAMQLSGLNSPMDGRLPAAWMVGREPTAQEIADTESDLATEYGITL